MRNKFIIFFLLKISNLFLTFFMSILISKKLSVIEFGNYMLIQSFIGLLIGALFSWSNSLIMFFGIKDKERLGNMSRITGIRNKLIFRLAIFLLISFILLRSNIKEYLKIDSLIVYGLIIFRMINDYIGIYLLSNNKKIESIILQILLKILALIYILLNKLILKKLIVALLFIELVGLIFIKFIDYKDFKKNSILDEKLKEKAFSFLKWQLVGFLGLSLSNHGDNFIIKELYSFQELGIYSIAYTYFLGMDSIIGIITSYINPEIIKAIHSKKKNKIKKYIKKNRYIIFIFCTLINIILMILSGPIFKILYKNNIDETVKIFRILSVGNIMRVWLYLYIVFFNTTNNFIFLQKLNIYRGFFNIVLSYFFIKSIGINGAAYATILTILISVIILTIKGEKIIKSNYFDSEFRV